MNAVAGRRPETVKVEPFRFDQMRQGCWDVDARVHDMDLNGVWASLSFPSMITGFCGRVYSQCSDPELGLATTRAWNDWMHDAWWSPHPDRIIPMGITWLADPEIGAAEIRRNAERGLPLGDAARAPAPDRLPVDLQRATGSRSSGPAPRPTRSCACTSARRDSATSRPAATRRSCRWPPPCSGSCRSRPAPSGSGRATVRFPDLKIAMSEGGIGWVAMLLDRLDNIVDRSGYGLGWDERPADVLRRNFWFCTIDDPSTIDTRHAIGVENIMVEVDYPHGDGTWPDTQAVIEQAWGHIPAAELRALCCENAARLYRHPLPEHRAAAGSR